MKINRTDLDKLARAYQLVSESNEKRQPIYGEREVVNPELFNNWNGLGRLFATLEEDSDVEGALCNGHMLDMETVFADGKHTVQFLKDGKPLFTAVAVNWADEDNFSVKTSSGKTIQCELVRVGYAKSASRKSNIHLISHTGDSYNGGEITVNINNKEVTLIIHPSGEIDFEGNPTDEEQDEVLNFVQNVNPTLRHYFFDNSDE